MQPASNVDPTLTGNSVRLDMLRDTVHGTSSVRRLRQSFIKVSSAQTA
jgi:hypothetical protein